MQGVDAIPEVTLGKFLVETGVISAEDLEAATQSMVLFGGRLGTNLIEAGILSVREVEEQLAAFHGLQAVPEEWLARPDPGARAALPAHVIERHSAYPLWFEKRLLHVGFLDPRNEAVIDEISFASGCTIVRYALPECRLAWMLEQHLGIKSSLRFSNLLIEASRTRQARAQRGPRPPMPDHDREPFAVDPVASDVELGNRVAGVDRVADLDATTDVILDAADAGPRASETLGTDALSEPGELPSEAETATIPRALRPAPEEISSLERVLSETPQREDVIRAAVRIASAHAELAALFVLRGGMASGACGWRDGAWLDVESIAISALHPSVLAEAANEKRIARAKPETPLDKRLAGALGRRRVRELVAIPILLGGRVVNVLLVDGASAPVSQSASQALARLAQMVGAAYERLIVARKQIAAGGP